MPTAFLTAGIVSELAAPAAAVVFGFLLNQFSFNSNLSYVSSENTSEDTSYGAFPTWLISLGGEYRTGQSKLGVWHRAMLDYELTDENQFQNTPNKNYQRTDLYLKHPIQPDLDIGVNIYNLFDHRNVLPSYYGSQGGLPDYGTLVKVSLNYQF